MAAAPPGVGEVLTEDDHKEIAAAIDAIEAKTAGDIYCLVAHEASNYRDVPLAWAALVALLLPPIALLAGAPPTLLHGLIGGWTSGQDVAHAHDLMLTISLYALVQAALFAFVALVTSIPPVRRLLTPAFLKRHRASLLAQQHFVSTGLHLGRKQPHVLIFLALMEKRVEIIAEEAVHRVAGEEVWQNARNAIIEGMRGPDPTNGILSAIEIAGAPLIEHFPATRRVEAEGVGEF